MTLQCENINLQKGSKGDTVREAQTILKQLGYYNGKTDGDYGDLTVSSVKSFQKKTGTLATDGIIGPITCKALQRAVTPSSSSSYYKNGVYHSGEHWIGSGCNKMGQCNGYYCACASLRQQLTKLGIENYTQQKIAQLAGTTTAGTSHSGIETAIAKISRETGKKLTVTWKNFSDFGNTTKQRMEAIGKILATQNKGIIWHTLYRNKYGHYESVQEINMNNNTCLVLNSLGNKCSSPAYCGYKETRSWNTMIQYLHGISQKSICIITKEE